MQPMTDAMAEQPWTFEEDSPRAVYASKCDELQCRKNSHLMRSLPGEVRWDVLTEMDLSWNFVGRVGVLPVIEVVRRSPNVVKLSLANNFLNNDSVREIVKHLVDHRCLGHLDLSRNPISHAAGKLLSRFAIQSPGLHTVLLEETLINPALVRIIQRHAAEKATGSTAPASRRSISSAPEDPTGDASPSEERRETPGSASGPEPAYRLPAGFAWQEFVGHASAGQSHRALDLLTEASQRPGGLLAQRHASRDHQKSSAPSSPTAAGGPPQQGEMLNLVFAMVQAAGEEAEGWQGLPSLWKVAKEDMPHTITSQLEDKSPVARRASLQPYHVPSRNSSLASDDDCLLSGESAGCYMAGIDYMSIAADRLQEENPELSFFTLRTFANIAEQLTGAAAVRTRLFSFEFAREDMPQAIAGQLEEKTEDSYYMAGIDHVSIAADRTQTPENNFFALRTFANLAELITSSTAVHPRCFSMETAELGMSVLDCSSRVCSSETIGALPCDAAMETVSFLCQFAEEQADLFNLPALRLLGSTAPAEETQWYALNILWELADRERDPDGDESWGGLRCVMSLVRPDL
eukprot:GGOE01049535.1.p1 GENE.GGOE01049535.1~~GGOE01049535.1.p1  ORF type:complete len:577 (+),score=175.51 GGOE01049535.1:50-1780(+)